MADSPFDSQRLRQARALLALSRPKSEGLGGLAAAAVFFVLSALTLAATIAAMATPGAT